MTTASLCLAVRGPRAARAVPGPQEGCLHAQGQVDQGLHLQEDGGALAWPGVLHRFMLSNSNTQSAKRVIKCMSAASSEASIFSSLVPTEASQACKRKYDFLRVQLTHHLDKI